jgi:hypothetical protein
MTARRSFAAACIAAFTLVVPLSAAALFGSTSITASGKVVRESRPVPAFTGIALSLPGKVELRQGSPGSVSVEADDNLIGEIETVVERGTLKIRFKHSISVSGRSTIRVLVTAPRFDSLAIAGSGDIVSEALSSPSLSVSIAGSGDVSLARLEADTLNVAISGSGDFKAAGRAADVSAQIVGSGDVDAARLAARRATISIAGSGDATVWASDTLEASIAGSGDVRYHGDPAVKKSVAGSGTVKRLGAAP